MSNTLAIATVTATLRAILNEALSGIIGGPVATVLRPDSGNLPIPCVNIFLYQVTPNAAFRNCDLPTRNQDGTLVRRPQLALDLHYLMTFHGEDVDFVPQLTLAAVALKLHAEPCLSPDQIAQAAATETGSGAHGFLLSGSTLANQIENIRITPSNLSLEELSKLWVIFPTVDYVLSAAYVVSVVLIETSDLPPGPALPVLRRHLKAIPFSDSEIDSVSPQPVEMSSPPTMTTITLTGQNLDPTNTVSFTTPSNPLPIPGAVLSGSGGNSLTVALPTVLRPGLNTVQLNQLAPMTSPPSPPSSPPISPHILSQSNAAPFLIRPNLGLVAQGSPPGQLVAVVSPGVAAKQQVALLLNPLGGQLPQAFALPANPRTLDTDPLTFSVLDGKGVSIPAGVYLVRVRVDSVESLLQIDGSGNFSGPLVTIT